MGQLACKFGLRESPGSLGLEEMVRTGLGRDPDLLVAETTSPIGAVLT